MSEYNIQMNKYNALNVEYDQLYPATKIENVDGLDIALQKKADLGEDGKVPESQLPEMDYAPSTHASQHASGGSDPITPASIGAAASSHNHSASNITSGTLGVARGGTGKSSVTSGNFLVGNGTEAMTEKTPAQVLSAIGAAPVKSPSFTGTPKAPKGTDYTTARVRNIQASTTDLTAGSSSLANGDIYLVYE